MWFRSSEKRRDRASKVLIEATKTTIEQLEGRVLLAATPVARSRGLLSSLGSVLTNEFNQYAAQFTAGIIDSPAKYVSNDHVLRQSKGRIAIEAYARPGHAAMLEGAFGAINASNIMRIGNAVSAYVSVHKLDDLAGNPHLNFAKPILFATSVGSTTSQGGQADGADIARSTYGLTGAGVKVGVLSDSFDKGPGSYAADQASGDLPAGVQVVQEYAGNGSDEGRAMLQLVNDAAPGASLAFASAFNSESSFANNIIALKNAGAKVIVDDVVYFDEPMFQDGIVAQAVDTVVAAGVSYFSSAGNNARASYESAFRPGAIRADNSIPGNVHFFGGRAHDFDPGAGVDEFQSFTLTAGQQIDLQFQWDTPFFSANNSVGADSEMDIYVLNSAGSQIVGGSAGANLGGDGWERLLFTNPTGTTSTFTNRGLT